MVCLSVLIVAHCDLLWLRLFWLLLALVTTCSSSDNSGPSPVYYVVYYESRKRELKKRRKNECRCDDRLKTKVEESTCLTYTGLYEELEHLKIKTGLIRAKFANMMCEYVI